MPDRAELERVRLALALCLTVEREDVTGFETLRSCLSSEGLIKGLVAVVRSLALGLCRSTGEPPAEFLQRLIDDVLAKEVARWW